MKWAMVEQQQQQNERKQQPKHIKQNDINDSERDDSVVLLCVSFKYDLAIFNHNLLSHT